VLSPRPIGRLLPQAVDKPCLTWHVLAIAGGGQSHSVDGQGEWTLEPPLLPAGLAAGHGSLAVLCKLQAAHSLLCWGDVAGVFPACHHA
jgi:hypothetical protein